MSLRDDAKGYQAIADDLRDQIRRGTHPDGSFLPTERELQAQYGVSRSTIRRALSALAESGWAIAKPNRGMAARVGPAQQKGSNVAFIDHVEAINQQLYFALSREMQAHGMHLTHIDSRTHGVEGALEYAANNGFSGALVWSKTGFPDVQRVRAVQARIPVVAVDHSLRGIATDLVIQDNLGGAQSAVEHLTRLGRRNIVVTGMMDMLEINHEKFSGYLRGHFSSGITPSPSNFVFCFTSGNEVADTSLLQYRLTQQDRPDAVFVLQDMFVPGVVETIFACGLRIPEDIAVVSFGDEFPVQIDDVRLTNVSVDWRSFAHSVVATLLRRLQRPLEPFTTTTLPMSLAIRGSCGAPSSEWTPELTTTEGPGSVIRRLHREYLQIRSDTVGRRAAVSQ